MAGFRISRIIILGPLIAACVALGGTVARALERVQGYLWSGLAYLVRMVTYPPSFLSTAGGPADYNPMGTYRGPADSFLRHEANVSRRAADRHT